MTDVVLIHPGATHGIYGSDLATSLVAVEPPLWPRLIAGYLLDRGHSVAIIDQEAEGIRADRVARRAGAQNPKVIAIVVSGHQPSASTQQMTGARAVAERLQAWKGDAKVITTGNHPSALPERTLREEPVDYVCDGEGPVTIEGLLHHISKYGQAEPHAELAKIPGLVWRRQTYEDGAVLTSYEVVRNPLAPLLDLDRDLHGRAWHLLPMEKYRAHNWQCLDNLGARQPYAAIYTSLNCPFACTFCMIGTMFHNHKYRMRNPVEVVKEIKFLYETYGIQTFKFVDEMFVLNQTHVNDICIRLMHLKDHLPGFEPNIWAYARVDTVNSQTQLDLLRDAGFRWLALGIESGSAEVRNGADKRLRTEDIVGTVRRVQAAGINVIGNFMFGLRDDDADTMRATLDLALECLPEWANFYSCHGYPGSALYDQALHEGWTLPETWAGFSQHNEWTRPLDTLHVDGLSVLMYRDYAFTRYFTDPRYLSTISTKFGPAAVEHVQTMTTYRLKRRLLEGEIA